jgi:hypothetical protein
MFVWPVWGSFVGAISSVIFSTYLSTDNYAEPEVEIRYEDEDDDRITQERNATSFENHATLPITSSTAVTTTNTNFNGFSTDQNGVLPSTERSRLLTSEEDASFLVNATSPPSNTVVFEPPLYFILFSYKNNSKIINLTNFYKHFPNY